ncbi:MAG TPA: ATP-dependent 6-phosphofructokinase [Methylomirabilota bacterium]
MAQRDLAAGRGPVPSDTSVQTLGACEISSPLAGTGQPFVNERDRVLLASGLADIEPYLQRAEAPPSFELAGARERIFFRPDRLTCAIVTCGGLCPGLNNVVRALVRQLTYGYRVRRILGFRYGYAGLAGLPGLEPVVLTPAIVDTAHTQGGTLLGTSRGPQDPDAMVATLQREEVGVLFVLGGDGGLRGASALAGEIARRGLPIAVIGIPKTIDNDLQWTWRCFGFASAVEAALGALQAAHTEAVAAWNGVGLVKLMGRHSGFIAAHATLASSDVNFCLVPEVPFTLEGQGGLLDALERRLAHKPHAVLAVAEGAGQELLNADPAERDASGNLRLRDIGTFLRDRIAAHFRARGIEVALRYIDPSYTLRSVPANAEDARYCLALGQYAAHAGLAGRTNMLVGRWNHRFIHVPIPLAVGRRRQLDPLGEEWRRVLETTGQPASLVGQQSGSEALDQAAITEGNRR